MLQVRALLRASESSTIQSSLIVLSLLQVVGVKSLTKVCSIRINDINSLIHWAERKLPTKSPANSAISYWISRTRIRSCMHAFDGYLFAQATVLVLQVQLATCTRTHASQTTIMYVQYSTREYLLQYYILYSSTTLLLQYYCTIFTALIFSILVIGRCFRFLPSSRWSNHNS
jgi:hypothetical protein